MELTRSVSEVLNEKNNFSGKGFSSPYPSTRNPAGSSIVPELNLGLFGMDSHALVISRGPQGYGFTVFGSSPVQIGRIEDGSPAAEAGLERYDCVVRINGQNVSRSTAESVAKIVRESELVIGLDIQRLRTGAGDSRNTKSTKASNFDSLPGNPVACASIGGILAGHLRRPQCLRGFGSQEFPRMGVTTTSKRLASESDRIRALDLDQLSVASSSDFSGSSASSSWRASSDETLVTSDSREDGGTTGGPAAASASFQFRRKARLGGGGGGADDPDEVNSDSGYGDRWRMRAMNCGKTSPNEDMLHMQWSAVRKLINYEEDFVYQLQLGARIFLKPLRQKQSILSTDEHRGLFQNLETILSLSETHLGQLHAHKNLNPNQSSSDADTDADDVSDIRLTVPLAVLTSVYLATIESFCEAYEKYCDGIREAFHLLVALKKTTDIEQFLNKATIDCGKLTLSSFLQKPIEHIKDLVLSLQKILCYTSANASGYDGLRQIIKALRSSCYRINENNSLRCGGSSLSLVSTESGTKNSLSPPSSSSSSSPSVANSIVSSIDTEVFEIQNRLLFPAHIPCFQLATASHHMIYSGKLKLIDDTGSWLPLFLVLMSDLILLTRPDPDGEVLHVLEEPIVLHDVVGCNFNCSHSSEFVLYVETPLRSLQRTWEPRCLRIRAPSGELKCTWKNILEQRIQTCKSNREVTISSRRLDNVV